MNFEQYLIKEGVLTSERVKLIEFLVSEGVDIESLDEGILDKMRGIKGVLLTAVAAANIFASVHGAIMTPKAQDFLAKGIERTMSIEVDPNWTTNDAELDNAVGLAKGVTATFDELKADGKMDNEDVQKTIDKVIEINPKIGKLVKIVNSKFADNTTPQDVETQKDVDTQVEVELEQTSNNEGIAIRQLEFKLKKQGLDVNDYDILVKKLENGKYSAKAVEKQ